MSGCRLSISAPTCDYAIRSLRSFGPFLVRSCNLQVMLEGRTSNVFWLSPGTATALWANEAIWNMKSASIEEGQALERGRYWSVRISNYLHSKETRSSLFDD